MLCDAKSLYYNTRLTNAQRTTVAGNQDYELPRLPLGELPNTVNQPKRSADSLVAARFCAKREFGGGAHIMGMNAN